MFVIEFSTDHCWALRKYVREQCYNVWNNRMRQQLNWTVAHLQLLSEVTNSFRLINIIKFPISIWFNSKILPRRCICISLWTQILRHRLASRLTLLSLYHDSPNSVLRLCCCQSAVGKQWNQCMPERCNDSYHDKSTFHPLTHMVNHCLKWAWLQDCLIWKECPD